MQRKSVRVQPLASDALITLECGHYLIAARQSEPIGGLYECGECRAASVTTVRPHPVLARTVPEGLGDAARHANERAVDPIAVLVDATRQAMDAHANASADVKVQILRELVERSRVFLSGSHEAMVTFTTRDHPEAGGRAPAIGAVGWTFYFPLDDGRTLYLKMGRDGRAALERVLLSCMLEVERGTNDAREDARGEARNDGRRDYETGGD